MLDQLRIMFTTGVEKGHAKRCLTLIFIIAVGFLVPENMPMRNISKKFGREDKNPGGCINPPPLRRFGWRNTLGICGLNTNNVSSFLFSHIIN